MPSHLYQNAFRRSIRVATFVCATFLITILVDVRLSSAEGEQVPKWQAGAAKRDITPSEAVRLSGYASRTLPTDKVSDPLSVRALYLAEAQSKPLMLISLDAIGIAPWMTEEIVAQATSSLKLSRSQIAICTTHSHSAPYLDGSIVNLFGSELPPEQIDATRRYSEFVVEQTNQAMQAAFENLQQADVRIGEGTASFAINRRPAMIPGSGPDAAPMPGPVDHRVRILSVKSMDGKELAVAFQYACHATTISPELNTISSDWAGLAAANLEKSMPGAIALPIIGTGADANPSPRGKYEDAVNHGKELSDAILAALPQSNKQLPAPSTVAFSYTALDFERPSIETLNAKLESPVYQERFWAKSMLDILKVKDRIPESYPAPAHLWAFGNELAWVFLGGEVVVDFQIRLEAELSQFANVWVASYVDDVFAYVASERVRNEGGYEVDNSMLYYNRPGRWISGTEEKWVKSLLDLQRQVRAIDEPLSAAEALTRIEVPAGWKVEQTAAEPMIEDPVNFSFGADGSVWVAEMGDYPHGDQGKGKIRRLRDTDGDGTLDESVVFIDAVDYPAGIIAWRDGVVIAAAPEVFFARDTDGDGVADEHRTILSGFPEANPQHRVHGFTYGIDGKLYFGTGVAANEVTLHKLDGSTETFHVHGSDLCLDPDRHELTLESGETQYIRAQDPWGNWFGNDNSHPLYHFVYDRNWKREGVNLPRTLFNQTTNPPHSPQVFPLSQPLDRFNEPYSANRFTSVCSSIINTSPATGEDMQGAALVCEPVHNLISRFDVKQSGMSFTATRFNQDSQSEWIRSDDPWFRPVRIVNAPDGTIWFADMYRRVIEHPTWIPEEWLARVDVYAGSQQGRLYRVYREDQKTSRAPKFDSATTERLIQILGDDTAAIAEMAQQQIIWNHHSDPKLAAALLANLKTSSNPQARLRSFSILKYLGLTTPKVWDVVLADQDPRVAAYALQEISRLSLEQSAAPGPSTKQLDACFERQDLISNPLFARLLFVVAVNNPDIDPVQCATLLLTHQSVPGVDGLLQFVDNDRFDVVAREVLMRADAGTQNLVEKLIPRISPMVQTELVETIEKFKGERPAWHFALATLLLRQAETANALNANFVDNLQNEAVKVVCGKTQSNLEVQRAALAFIKERSALGDESVVKQIVQSVVQNSNSEFSIEILRALSEQSADVWSTVLDSVKESESARSATVQTLLAQSRSASWILDRLISKEVSLPTVAPSVIENLRNQTDASLLEKVSQVFGADLRVNRDEIVQQYVDAWPKDADASRGALLYKQHCATCHSEREVQGEKIPSVGPTLSALNHWTNDAWITGILNPSKSVDAKYLRTTILTEDDEVISGLKISETDQEIEIVTTDGRIERIEKSNIAESKESNLSLMPDGFEKSLDPQQIADLVKFLRTSE